MVEGDLKKFGRSKRRCGAAFGIAAIFHGRMESPLNAPRHAQAKREHEAAEEDAKAWLTLSGVFADKEQKEQPRISDRRVT